MLLHSMYLPWVHTIETTNISRRRRAIQPSPAATNSTPPLGSIFKWSQRRQSASTFAPPFKQYKSYRLILWAAKVSQTEDKAVEPSRSSGLLKLDFIPLCVQELLPSVHKTAKTFSKRAAKDDLVHYTNYHRHHEALAKSSTLYKVAYKTSKHIFHFRVVPFNRHAPRTESMANKYRRGLAKSGSNGEG